jgi:hypothetical protein
MTHAGCLAGFLFFVACSTAPRTEASKNDLPSIPKLDLTSYRPQLRAQVEQAMQPLEVKPAVLSEVGRGVAFGDIDNNGTVLVVASNNGPVRLLLNESAPRGHWLEVKLQGTKSNRAGIGARVSISRPGQPALVKHAHIDGSYLSASDSRVHFGLGSATEVRVSVAWPAGLREEWNGVKADALVTLREGAGKRR